MSHPHDELRAALKQHGYSLTTARHAVFSALLDSEPLDMHDVIETCAADADRASVYRAIALFEELGIVHRLQMGWKYRLELTDSYSQHHHHLSCVACGRIIPLPEDPLLEQQLQSLAHTHDFQPQTHQLEIRGLCVECHQNS